MNKLKNYVEKNIGNHQAGFMRERSTKDQIFIMKELASKYYEYKKNLFILQYSSTSRPHMKVSPVVGNLESFEKL